MTDERPSPELLLKVAAEEERRRDRGRLKLFFGAAAGVGKTFAMLEEGHRLRNQGVDVVLGWVETHGRVDTARLVAGFERLAPRVTEHRGVRLEELDLDAAIQRRPTLILVDELPHTNAPGSRHARRWQDVDELLSAGIDVFSTLNVQHVESLVDVVARITGVTVRETVPDAFIDAADAIELIDLPPEELLGRLRDGNIYREERAQAALRGFFSKANLTALRELALRRTAEKVDAEVVEARRVQGTDAPWATSERLLVAVGPAPQSADLVRSAARMAGRLHAPWIAVSVEPVAASEKRRAQVAAHLALAERLGGEAVVLRGDRPVDALVKLARERNATRIMVGRPTHPRWRDRLYGSFIEDLVRSAEGIDVLVTVGVAGQPVEPSAAPPLELRVWELVEGFTWVAVAAGFGMLTRPWFTLADQAMMLLAAVVVAAGRVGRIGSVVAAISAVALLDFLFVPPFYTLAVSDGWYFITFGVMLAVGLFVGDLTHRVRAYAEAAQRREQRTAALFAMSRDLAAATDPDQIRAIAVRHANGLLESGAVLVRADGTSTSSLSDRAAAVARWVIAHGRPAGAGTDTLPGSEHVFLPMLGASGVFGALGVAGALSPSRKELLEVIARNAGAALERAELAAASAEARVVIETERTRTSLLSAVSHDLRTPLAAITGAASTVLADPALGVVEVRRMVETIRAEADRLGRLIAGLLDLTRLEASLVAKREWVPVDEVVASAVERFRSQVGGISVSVSLPEEVVQAPMDPVLVDQLLFNLLENAARHAGTPVEIAVSGTDRVVFTVSDRGPGLPVGSERDVFERFWRAPDGGRGHGTGLGLAIAHAIARVHGGALVARQREGGGAVFEFTLPVSGVAPEVPPEDPED